MKLNRITAARRPAAHAHLTAGLVALAVAGALFGAIAVNVMGGGKITVLDMQLARWFHGHASAGLTRAMLAVSHMHSTAAVLALTALLGLHMWRRQARVWLAALAVVPGGMLANVLLKHAFSRARPGFADPILSLATYSFPSGHASSATLFYGMLAAYLVCQTRDWRRRSALVAGAALMVALVGASRMYLGVHYFSDVLAALAEGCAWLALCLTLASSLRLRRSKSMTGEKY